MQYKEQEYIKYQIQGHFNTREAYKQMDSKLEEGKTIAEAFKSKFDITEKEYRELTIKHNDIPELKKKYNNKRHQYYSKDKNKNRPFFNFEEFYNWYKKHTKNGEKCCYCGVDQEDAVNSKIYERSARYEKRGKSIEIERVVTFPEEKNIYSDANCRLACYVCNNAKSDFISAQEFEPIARGIHNFWKEKVKKEIDFPEDVYKPSK